GGGSCLHAGLSLGENAAAMDHIELDDGNFGRLRGGPIRRDPARDHRSGHFHAVIAGVGGNGATQTATVIIRAIALGELEFSSAWKAVVKQVLVNVCIALAAGGVIAAAAFLWKGNPFLGLVLASAMILNLGLM